MPDKKPNIGIIGAGFISQVAHIPHYAGNQNCNLLAIAELRPNLRKAVAQRWNIERQYENHTQLLEDPDIDGVVIVVRRHHTGPLSYDALNAKKNIFTEKPFVQTAEKANSIVQIAAENNLIHSVGFMRRYDSGVIKAKEYIDRFRNSNELGKMLSARFYLSAGGDYCNIGGEIKSDEPKPMEQIWPIAPDFIPEEYSLSYEHFVNVAGHDINLIRYLLGDNIEIRHAVYKPGTGSVATMDTGKNFVTFEWADTLQPTRWEEGCEFRYEKGFLKLKLHPAFLRNQPSEVQVYIDQGREGGEYIQPCPDWSWAFENEDNEFINCLIANKNTISSAADSINDFKLIDGIWRSILETI